MKDVFIALLFGIFSFTAVALPQPQDADSLNSNGSASREVVIVSWRHFSSAPAPDVGDPPSSVPPAAPGAGAVPDPPDPVSADPPAQAAQPQIMEQDIRHNPPGPLEPVPLPLADQNAAPLAGQPRQTPSPPAAQPNTPEAEVVALTTGFEERERNRDAQRKELESAAAKDPASQALASIKETQLLLEGEQDRLQSAQQLSKEFADLADELNHRATQIQSMASTHQQAAAQAQDQLKQLVSQTPRLDLTLHNVAMLPPGAQNDSLISNLNSQLAQDDATRAHDQELAAQEGHETQALAADAVQLNRAAAEARKKSAEFSQAAADAKINEGRLTDRLQYTVARQRAGELLQVFSKTVQSSVALTANVAITKDVLTRTDASPSPAKEPANRVDSLRECIRQSDNVDACRAKEGQ